MLTTEASATAPASKGKPAQSKSSTGGAGSKRKASGAAAGGKAKKGKKAQGKEDKAQTTIEDTMPVEVKGAGEKDVEMKDAGEGKKGEASNGGEKTAVDEVIEREAEIRDQEPMGDEKGEDAPPEKKEVTSNGDAKDSAKEGEEKNDTTPAAKIDAPTNGEATTSSSAKEEEPKKNGFDTLMDASAGTKEDKNITAEGTGSKVSAADNAVEESSERAEAMPSSILEKGIIYFFFRGRVGINEPSDVNDIARSYIILRPMPHGAKLGEGPIGDAKNIRMLALPKKVLPVSPKDRFMTFVEKANVSLEEVKQQLSSSDYSTKTVGVRHTPAAAPIGEGVYAITKTGRETHLAYILTVPSEINEVQKAVGLRQQGSYLTSAKNPKSASPANASLPKGADYPQEYVHPKHCIETIC
jgi:hypothetical protein